MPDEQLTIIFGTQGAETITTAIDALKKAGAQLKQTFEGAVSPEIKKAFTDFGDAFKHGAEAAQSMGGMVQLLSGGLAAMATPLGLVAIGIGAVVEVASKLREIFEDAAKEAESVFYQMRQLTAVTGENVSETKALVDAFQLAGFGSEALTRAMFRLSMEIESGGERLAAYGIRVREMDGGMRTPLAVFTDIIKKVGELDNAAERSAFLRHLFGRQGVQLAALAGAGASLDDLIAKAKELGIYDEAEQKQTEELVKAKAKLSLEMEHLWLEIAKTAVPIMTRSAELMGKIANLALAAARAVTRLKDTFSEALSVIGNVVKGVENLVMTIAARLSPIPPSWLSGVWNKLFGKGEAKAEAPAEAGAGAGGGPIITPQSITAEAKLAEERLKINAKYFAEVARLQSTSHAEALRVELKAFDERLALEREKVRKLQEVTEDPVKKRKLREELALKEVEIEGEKNLLLIKIQEAEAEDAKKNLEIQLTARKAVADEEVRIVESRKEEQLRLVDRVQSSEEAKIKDRMTFEVGAARDVSAIKRGVIDEEIVKLTTLAAEYKDNATLQRDIAQQIAKLNHERTVTEIEEVRQVDKARDDAAKSEMARQEKMAGMFSQLARQAEEYAKAQGRKTITTADVAAAQAKLSQESQLQLSTFFGGGAVDPAKLQQAMQFQQQQRQMQQMGATPEGIQSAAFGQVSKTFGAGFGYDAATQAFQRGDIAGGQRLYQAAGMQADVERAAAGITPDDKVGKIVGDIKDKGTAAINDMIGKIPDIMGDWFTNFSDQLIRKLEFEAART